MAHNINTFMGKTAAWHDLGDIVGENFTIEEVLAHPGFDYRVFVSQLQDGLGRKIDSYGAFRWNRKDEENGNKHGAIFLANVGKDYNSKLDHREGAKTLKALIGDGRYLDAAGVLGKGEKVWFLVDLGQCINVGKDESKCYLLFVTGLDGSLSHMYRITVTRVVCQNTLNVALSEKTGACFKVRHTKNGMDRLVDARAALASMSSDITTLSDKLNFLAGRRLTRDSLVNILDRVFPKTEKFQDGQLVQTDSTRRQNILADVLRLYEFCDGNVFPEQRGTSYNLLNAITDYTDHQRSSKDDGRALSAMFGSGDQLKTRALETILEASEKLDPMRTSGNGVVVDFADLGLNVPGVRSN